MYDSIAYAAPALAAGFGDTITCVAEVNVPIVWETRAIVIRLPTTSGVNLSPDCHTTTPVVPLVLTMPVNVVTGTNRRPAPLIFAIYPPSKLVKIDPIMDSSTLFTIAVTCAIFGAVIAAIGVVIGYRIGRKAAITDDGIRQARAIRDEILDGVIVPGK